MISCASGYASTRRSRLSAIGGSPRPPWIRIGTRRSAASSNTGAPRVLERAVVRGPEGRVPVRLVHAEHEAAPDPVAVVDPLELVVDPVEAVDVVPEVDVGVEDLRALGHVALELLVVGGDQSP